MTAHDTARGGTGARPLIILAAGGTGGHVFPAEALAGVLDRRGYRLALVTDRRGESYGGTVGSLENHQIRAGGIAGKSLLARFRSVPELALGTLQARTLLRRLKPRVVVGFGGYASVPTMLAAAFADCRTALHEQNAVLGRANRLLAGRADRIGLSFEDTRGLPEGARARSVHTGMPVRPAAEAFVPSSLQFIIGDGLDDAAIERFLAAAAERGVHVKWFGAADPIGFTSRHDHWRYLEGEARVPTADRLLHRLCDIRLPLWLAPDDCRAIADVLRQAMALGTSAAG